MIKAILKNILPYGISSNIHRRNIERNAARKKAILEEKIRAIVGGSAPVNLELGSGAKKGSNGWTTMDLNKQCDLPHNLLNNIPFPDVSVDKIYSSHFLEHFYTRDIVRILKESYRVLKPGGWISACVPDGSLYVMAYAKNKVLDPDVWLRYKPAATIFSPIDIINYMAYMDDEHKHLFDIDNLIALFASAGFKNVRQRSFNPELDLEVRDYQSIYVEGTK